MKQTVTQLCKRLSIVLIVMLAFVANAEAGDYYYYAKATVANTAKGKVYVSQNSTDELSRNYQTESSSNWNELLSEPQNSTCKLYIQPDGVYTYTITWKENDDDYGIISYDSSSCDVKCTYWDAPPSEPIDIYTVTFGKIGVTKNDNQNVTDVVTISNAANETGDNVTLAASTTTDGRHFAYWVCGFNTYTDATLNLTAGATAQLYTAHFTANSTEGDNFEIQKYKYCKQLEEACAEDASTDDVLRTVLDNYEKKILATSYDESDYDEQIAKLETTYNTYLTNFQLQNAKAYTYVQQNDTKVETVGTAAFDLSKSPTVKFVDGKAVMTVGSNTIAQLPMSDGGQLAVEFTGTVSNVSKTVSDGYATVYSPFQLQVPATGDVEVYAPTYEAPKLKLNGDTKVAAGAVIPAGTGLILKYDEETATSSNNINFTFSDGAATDTHTSALSGSALTIAKPVESGKTVYTLGHETTTNEYGFFAYTGENMNPGLAYLLATTLSDSQNAKYVSFSFDDDDYATVIEEMGNGKLKNENGKFIENGRVVIVKNGQKYNLSGMELK